MLPTARQWVVFVGYFTALLVFGIGAIFAGRSMANPLLVVLGVLLVVLVVAMIPWTVFYQVRLRRRLRATTPPPS